MNTTPPSALLVIPLLLGGAGCGNWSIYQGLCEEEDSTPSAICEKPDGTSPTSTSPTTSPTETDTDTDTETDTNTDVPKDSGVGVATIAGRFTIDDGVLVEAWYSFGVYGRRQHDYVCRVEGALPYEGTAAPGCPNCEWSFNLGPVTGGVAEGALCDDFGLFDDALDGNMDHSWGFSRDLGYDDYWWNIVRIEYQGNWYPFMYDCSYCGDAVETRQGFVAFEEELWPRQYYYY